MIIGLASVGLCFALPVEISEYIEAIIGGTTGAASLKYFSSVKQSKVKVNDSDFYFPFMLHQKS